MRRPDFECWPDFRVTIRPLPWTWRLKPWLYVDDVEGARCHWSLQWLAVTVEWWGDKPGIPLFPMLPDRAVSTGEDPTNGGQP